MLLPIQLALLSFVNAEHAQVRVRRNGARERERERNTYFSRQQTHLVTARVFNDFIEVFTKSDFKSFLDDFDIFEITLKDGDLIGDWILRMEHR
jgi:hypothetical protein